MTSPSVYWGSRKFKTPFTSFYSLRFNSFERSTYQCNANVSGLCGLLVKRFWTNKQDCSLSLRTELYAQECNLYHLLNIEAWMTFAFIILSSRRTLPASRKWQSSTLYFKKKNRTFWSKENATVFNSMKNVLLASANQILKAHAVINLNSLPKSLRH